MLLIDIFGIEKTGKYKGDVINRAYVLATILEKYNKISASVKINKDGKIEFLLQKDKKKISIIFLTGCNLVYKVGRKKGEGVFFSRTFLLPLLKELNNA